MLQTYNVTFIPIWLENIMARTGMNFSDVIAFKKLLGIVSKSDLVFYYLALEQFNDIYLPHEYGVITRGGELFPGESYPENFIATVDIERTMTAKQNLGKELTFLKYALGETADLNALKDVPFVFQATLIDERNIVVTMRISDTAIDQNKFYGNFYDQLLKILNYNVPFHELAATKLFKTFNRYLALGVMQ